jgi:hypothetical protein
MKLKTLNMISVALNIFAIAVCSVALIINFYTGNVVWVIVQTILIVMNAYFAYTGYQRYKEDMKYERMLNVRD